MRQLLRPINSHNEQWSNGYTSFFTGQKSGPWHLPLAVRCRIGTMDLDYLALLDTGAEWSVIGGETAMILEDELGSPTESFSMSTRLGKIIGALYRINITLLAENNCGHDLTIESSVFVSEEWDGPIVLGFRGFLERIRFAVDPGMVPDEQLFFFGMAE